MRKSVNIYDLYNKNFESWFKSLVDVMTDQQKQRLPEDLQFKLFRNKKGINGELGFKEMVYILSICFNKSVTILVEDENEGITINDFAKVRRAKQAQITNTDLLNVPRVASSFVMGDKNLMESMLYLNHVYTTEIYGMVKKINDIDLSKRGVNFAKNKEAIKSVIRLVTNYDMNKKSIGLSLGLTTAEIYAILYFSSGEKLGIDFYNKDFKFAHNANRSDMHKALKRMEVTGYLMRRGERGKSKYSITGKGVDLLNKILHKIITLYKV